MFFVDDVSDKNFEVVVLESVKPVVVDFWAAWCGPCLQIVPVLEQLALECAGKAVFVKLDADTNFATVAKYGVISLPTIAVFSGGEMVKSVSGVRTKLFFLQEFAEFLL